MSIVDHTTALVNLLSIRTTRTHSAAADQNSDPVSTDICTVEHAIAHWPEHLHCRLERTLGQLQFKPYKYCPDCSHCQPERRFCNCACAAPSPATPHSCCRLERHLRTDARPLQSVRRMRSGRCLHVASRKAFCAIARQPCLLILFAGCHIYNFPSRKSIAISSGTSVIRRMLRTGSACVTSCCAQRRSFKLYRA